ncbi:MAG: hypothetical protein ACPL7B_01000 [Candidatus Poribacteria bacterium]
MKKIIMLSLIFCVVVSSMAYGASARWQALGNEHRFIIDTSNYGIYPARVYQFSNAVWLIPRSAYGDNDIMAGVLMKLNDNMMWAYHFNVPSAGVGKLSTALKAYDKKNDRLAGLEPKVFPDIFWAMKSGSTTFALRGALAMDKANTDDVTTNAMAFDINAGVTTTLPLGDLDIGVGVGVQKFSDDDGAKVTESTGGFALAVDARLNMPCKKDKNITWVPIASLKIGSDPTESGVVENSYLTGDVGFGMRKMFDKKMVVTGLVAALNSSTTTPSGGKEVKTTTIAPKFIAGCEAPLTKWLIVRGGANVEFSMKSNDVSTTDVKYYYNSGIRILYGGFIVDWILARDFFYRGPYFISGSGKDGSNFATNICLTYAF